MRFNARWQKQRRGKPQAPEIFVFFKQLPPREMGDAGPQLQKVLAFRKSLEDSRQVLSHGFAGAGDLLCEIVFGCDVNVLFVPRDGACAVQASGFCGDTRLRVSSGILHARRVR